MIEKLYLIFYQAAASYYLARVVCFITIAVLHLVLEIWVGLDNLFGRTFHMTSLCIFEYVEKKAKEMFEKLVQY